MTKDFSESTPDGPWQSPVRHFHTILTRWKGGAARMWELTASHATLTVIVTKPDRSDTLGVHCAEPLYVRGPCRWENCELTVTFDESGGFVLQDVRADVEIRAEKVEMAEYKERYFPMRNVSEQNKL